MRHLHGEAERVPAGLAEAQLEQGGRAARHLDPALQPLVAGQQFLAGGVRDHPERAGVRHPGRNAEEADRRTGVEEVRASQHGPAEQVPFVVGHRSRQQQERALALVVEQVQESAEVAELVRALEEQYDTAAESQQAAADAAAGLLSEGEAMPTGDELAAQFERFLAENQDRTDPPGPPGGSGER